MTVYPYRAYRVHMVKVNHFLPAPQLKALRALAKKNGLSVAELIRRAIEEFLKKQ